MTNFTIEPCTKENTTAILNGINTYNLSKVAAIADVWTPLDFVIKNEAGVEIAGILAGNWVLERARYKNIMGGRSLS